jgi:hypothetical protein
MAWGDCLDGVVKELEKIAPAWADEKLARIDPKAVNYLSDSALRAITLTRELTERFESGVPTPAVAA